MIQPDATDTTISELVTPKVIIFLRYAQGYRHLNLSSWGENFGNGSSRQPKCSMVFDLPLRIRWRPSSWMT